MELNLLVLEVSPDTPIDQIRQSTPGVDVLTTIWSTLKTGDFLKPNQKLNALYYLINLFFSYIILLFPTNLNNSFFTPQLFKKASNAFVLND